jgi:hypothetical protein
VGVATHPCDGTPTTVWTRTASPAASSAALVRSIRDDSAGEGAGGRTAKVSAAITSATGTLTTNTVRQPRCATIAPPSMGPVAEPSRDDEERGHREQVAGAGPLDLRHARAEVASQTGLRHDQNGAVHRDDHRAGHADQEYRASLYGARHEAAGPR